MKYDVDSHFRVPTDTVLSVTFLAPVVVLMISIIFCLSSCWSFRSLEKLATLFSMHLLTVMTRGADNEAKNGVPSQGASSSGGQPKKHLLFKDRLFKNGAKERFVRAYSILLPLQLFTLAIIAVNVVFVEEYEGNSCQWYNSTVLPEKEFYSCRLRRKFIDNGVMKIDDYCNNSTGESPTGESPGESADDILCIQFYFYKSRLLTVATSLVVWNGVVASAMLYVVIFYSRMVDIFPANHGEKSEFDIWLEASCTCKWIPRSFVRCLSFISISFVHLFAWIPSVIIIGLAWFYIFCTDENTQSDLIISSAVISSGVPSIMMVFLCYYLKLTKTSTDEKYNHFDAYPLVGVACAENKNEQVNQVVNNENNDSSALVSPV